MDVVTVKDAAGLVEMHAAATRCAREYGVRQRVWWGTFKGRLNPCSDDFGDGFCCGERPWSGWVWMPAEHLDDPGACGPVEGWAAR